MSIRDVYNSVFLQVHTNPRSCSVCGCIESMDNFILEYEGNVFLCDDCLLTYDFERRSSDE